MPPRSGLSLRVVVDRIDTIPLLESHDQALSQLAYVCITRVDDAYSNRKPLK